MAWHFLKKKKTMPYKNRTPEQEDLFGMQFFCFVMGFLVYLRHELDIWWASSIV